MTRTMTGTAVSRHIAEGVAGNTNQWVTAIEEQVADMGLAAALADCTQYDCISIVRRSAMGAVVTAAAKAANKRDSYLTDSTIIRETEGANHAELMNMYLATYLFANPSPNLESLSEKDMKTVLALIDESPFVSEAIFRSLFSRWSKDAVNDLEGVSALYRRELFIAGLPAGLRERVNSLLD